MTRTDRPKTGNTTYHRDGTVTMWSIIDSGWIRGDDPSASTLSPLPANERARVMRHCGIED